MRSYEYEAPGLAVLGPVAELTLGRPGGMPNPPGKQGNECDASAFVSISPPGQGTPPHVCDL